MMKRSALILGGLALAAGFAAMPQNADARVFVGVGIGVPVYGFGYGYGYGPYYYPPAVVVAPPPVVYAAPPAPTSYIQQPQQYSYYCDNPQGYYPSVPSCSTPWREVPRK
ncbi:MAG TPA: hypothetical protein VH722_10045 [Alphaproteobacteria bacterium]|nr:hypothetical protein [Alphaproteobacteria bacterium]